MVKVISTNSRKKFVSHICDTIKQRACEEIRTKSFFTLVLSGGSTPKDIFEELVLNYKETIDWNNVHLFWVDERCVNQSHKDSNYKLANDNLISNNYAYKFIMWCLRGTFQARRQSSYQQT